jgi:hypothetical protein
MKNKIFIAYFQDNLLHHLVLLSLLFHYHSHVHHHVEKQKHFFSYFRRVSLSTRTYYDDINTQFLHKKNRRYTFVAVGLRLANFFKRLNLLKELGRDFIKTD